MGSLTLAIIPYLLRRSATPFVRSLSLARTAPLRSSFCKPSVPPPFPPKSKRSVGRCRHCRSSTCVRLVCAFPCYRTGVCSCAPVFSPSGCAPTGGGLPNAWGLRPLASSCSSFLVVASTSPYGLRYWCALRSHIFCRLPPCLYHFSLGFPMFVIRLRLIVRGWHPAFTS